MTVTSFLRPYSKELQLEGTDLQQMWFQQDGATCHTAREPIAQLREQFSDNLISNRGDQNSLGRSCDPVRLFHGDT